MLPPVRQRTQMGDILAWAGGRRSETPRAPEDSHPGEERYRRVAGILPEGGGGPPPHILPVKPGAPPIMKQKLSVPELQRGISPIIGKEVLQTPVEIDNRVENAANRELSKNIEDLSKRMAKERSQNAQLATQNETQQEQLFAIERIVRLVADRLSMVENRTSNMSKQVDERGRGDAEILRKLQMNVRELQELHTSFVKDVAAKLAQGEDLNIKQDREQMSHREQIRSLQSEFRDFAVQSVYRQRQEVETLIKNQFSKHHLDENEFRDEMRKAVDRAHLSNSP